MVGSLKPKALI